MGLEELLDEYDRERKKEYNRKWNANNKQHKSDYNKRYYAANKEKIFAQRKADTAPAPKRERRLKAHNGLPIQRVIGKLEL